MTVAKQKWYYIDFSNFPFGVPKKLGFHIFASVPEPALTLAILQCGKIYLRIIGHYNSSKNSVRSVILQLMLLSEAFVSPFCEFDQNTIKNIKNHLLKKCLDYIPIFRLKIHKK